MIGLFEQKQKGYQPSPSTTIIPPPPPRTGGTIKKEPQVFIKPEDFERLLQEWLETEPEGFEVDEDKIEELEDYIEYRRNLRELTRKMVEEELDRYLVKKEQLTYNGTDLNYRNVSVTCNEIEIALTKWHWLRKTGGAYCITNMNTFKQIMAALGNPTISNAFPQNDEDIYINCKQYILDQGGTIKYSGDRFDSSLKITLKAKE